VPRQAMNAGHHYLQGHYTFGQRVMTTFFSV
jgi:hypothetical protein